MLPENTTTASKPKLALLVNLIAPYRVPVYQRLAEFFELFVLHGPMEANRAWADISVPGAQLREVWGWQFRLPMRTAGKIFDYRYLHIEPGYLLELLRIRPAAILTTELGFRTLLALVYGFLFRVPVWVWWGGTQHTERNLSRMRRALRYAAARVVRHWISYGQTSTQYLRSLNIPRDRILQIQNCVDESWYTGHTAPAMDLNPKPVVLHVGQLIARKGIRELIEAASKVQREGHRFSLVFVGGGPELAELRRLAAELELAQVHFYPPQPAASMAGFYRSADVLVFPTLQDVWGLVANEAILSGLPVLCSRYAGCARELFPPECIFDPDDTDSFSAGLHRAVAGRLPRVSAEKLKKSRDVAEMIVSEVNSVLHAHSQAQSRRHRCNEGPTMRTICLCMLLLAASHPAPSRRTLGTMASNRPLGNRSTGSEKAGLPSPNRKSSLPIPATLFGMHIHNIGVIGAATNPAEPWPSVPFGGLRLWDSGVDWASLEPLPGQWHFDRLDQDAALAAEQHVDILLTLGLTPAWASARPDESSAYGPGKAAEPKNLDDWRNYVRTVAMRYRDRIRNYEVWNEPNHPKFYTGDMEHMIQLTCAASQVLKAISPEIKVVSPSPTRGMQGVAWLNDFLAQGGGNCVDIIAFHFYANTPEQMLPIIRGVQAAMARHGVANKPLWNTETGWPIVNHQTDIATPGPNALSDDQSCAYLARAYLLQWQTEVSRFYYYAWDDRRSGLTEEKGALLKASANAYARLYAWLAGSQLTHSRMDADGTWTLALAHPDGTTAWIVWNPHTATRWSPPAQTKIRSAVEITGKQITPSADGSIIVNSIPTLIQGAH